jgi:hypothetical protein
MYELTLKEDIEGAIYEVRGVQVMLVSDVAKFYEVETKRINEVIKRNIDRFPKEFYFQLEKDEAKKIFLELHKEPNNETSKQGKHFKYEPYVLTEQGIMMLSGLLKSDLAVQISIRIIEAFVRMRHYISNNLSMQNELLISHENRISLLEKAFEKKKINNENIFYKGQIYDAYSLIRDILKEASEEIIIIDNYIDKNLLDILCKENKKIIVITNKYNNMDYEKYKKQYNNIKLFSRTDFHDRFIILDRNILYHCGASIKDLGKKCFAISLVQEESIKDSLLEKIKV